MAPPSALAEGCSSNYDRGVAGRGAESISFTHCEGKKESGNSSGRMFYY